MTGVQTCALPISEKQPIKLSWRKIECLPIVIHLVTGAAQPKINQENMSTIPIIVPPQIVMQQFNQKICLIFNYKKLKETENIELIRLQSLLLAKMRQ